MNNTLFIRRTVRQRFRPLSRVALLAGVLMAATTSLMAQVASALEKPASVSTATVESQIVRRAFDRARLSEILSEIGKESGVRVMYGEDVLSLDRPLTLKIEGLSAREALETAIRGTGLSVVTAGSDALAIIRVPNTVMVPMQAVGIVTGIVTGTASRPVAGAQVNIVGTTLGDVTGADGRYTITGVPAGSRIVRANFAGYGESRTNVTVTSGQTVTANIVLTAQVVQLEGVVAVGYGTMRRQDITGSVGAVTTDAIESRPIRGATEALTAQISGVKVATTTGAPGSGGEVQIRGQSAIGAGASPLYVVDGFPISPGAAGELSGFAIRSPLAEIPPDEIAEITVLKDASSAAIYGSQAANGVVIITTKRGQQRVAPAINIQAYTGLQTIDWARFPDLANATEFATYMNRRDRQLLWVAGGRTGPLPAADDPRIDARWRNPSIYGEGTNWYREILQRAPTHSVTASVSGGSERVRAYLSGGVLLQDGLVLNTEYRRLNARANVDATLTDRLTFAFGIAPTLSHRNLQAEGGQQRDGGFGSVTHAWPVDSVYGADGSLKKLIWGSTGGATLRNPVNVLQETDDSENSLTTQINSDLSYRLFDGVTLKTSLNARRSTSQATTFEPSTLWSASGPAIPSGTFETNSSFSWVSESTVDVNRDLSDAITLQALGGFSAQVSSSEGGNFTGNDFPDDNVRTLNAARTITGSTNESEWSLASVYGRMNLNLLDRYVVTATARADGSSRFGSANRWGTFPSIALAWHLSEEPFMGNVGWVSNVSLRGSLGYTGNNQIGNYPSFGRVITSDYVFGTTTTSGRTIDQLGNPELGWERSREMNLGLDASFLEGRVSTTIEAYRRKTENLLLSLELPAATGFGSVTANHGSIQNQGLEFTVNTQNVSTANFGWTTNANLYLNRNKTLSLPGNDTVRAGGSEGGNTHLTVVGEPIGLFWGFNIIGVYSQADINNACSEGAVTAGCVAVFPGAVAGDMRMTDVNGDGVIRQHEDYMVLGSPWPDFSWGLTNNITWGRLNFRAIIDGQVGGMRWDRLHYTYENIDGPFNVTKRYVDNMYISVDSVGNGLTPAAGSSSAAGRRHFRTINSSTVHDADFIWIRNLNFGFQLPERLTGIGSAQLYFSADNPYIFTSYFGNPLAERNDTGGTRNLQPGVDAFSYPIPRIWTLGINLQM